MAWRAPRGLQWWAARAAAVPLVTVSEANIRYLLALVPAELLIARATAHLLLREDEKNDDEDSDADEEGPWAPGSDSPGQVDVMDHVLLLIKGALEELRRWWARVPGKLTGPGWWLESALNAYTEVHPRHDQDFPRHLTCLLLRLVLQEKVFLDRDYGDKDRRCVVPFAWERWTARLVARLAPFPQLQHLRVYGGMYPSILAAVLRGAPHLSTLHISHINITDDILLVVAKSCPRLNTLYLLHNFPWQVISMKAFCAAFFGGATKREVTRAIRSGCLGDVKITFPLLKEVDLAYGDIEVAREFHKLLLTFYPSLTSLSCPWKTTHFEDGYQTHGREVIIPLVSRDCRLAVSNIFLDGETLYNLDPPRLHKIVWCCPQVQAVTLDCDLRGPQRVCEAAGSTLTQLLPAWKQLSQLHVNVNSEDHLTCSLLMPSLRVHGAILTTLTVEAAAPGQVLHVATLNALLLACPNLTQLNVRVWSRSMVEAQFDAQEGLELPQCIALQKFSLHEEGPGDADEPRAEERHVAQWQTLLQRMVAAAPTLTTLSLSLCRGLASLMGKLACGVHTLHLHIKDGYEWQPTADQVSQLVCRLPQLHHLYLEEVSGQVFWRLRRRYQHTDLQLHWGNLHGWPRT